MATSIKNVFIDVGSHRGEAIEEALRPVYDLHRFITVEPSTSGYKKISEFRDSRLENYNYAVSNKNTKLKLYSAGSVGGGLYSDKLRHWQKTETVNVLKFSNFILKNTNSTEKLFIKINVEGSEYRLLKELLLVKNRNIVSILLSIDIEKVPSLHKFRRQFKSMIEEFPYPITVREEKNVGKAIKIWLTTLHLRKHNNVKYLVKDIFRLYLPFDRNIIRIIKPIFPSKLWIKLALKYGPNRKINKNL